MKQLVLSYYDSFEFEDETASAQEETRLEAEQIACRPTTTLSRRAVSISRV